MSRRRTRMASVLGAAAVACSAAAYLLSRGDPAASARRPGERGASARVHAGPVTAGAAGEAQEPPAAVSPLFDSHAEFKAGETVALRFRALDGSGSPATSEVLTVSIARPPGGEEARLVAREIGGGIYEVPFTPGDTGPFQLVLTSDVAARPLAAVTLQVGGEAAPAGGSAGAEEPGSEAEQAGDEGRRLRTFRLMRRGGRR